MSLEGNLEDLCFGDLLQIVSLSRKSGVLCLHSMGRDGKVFFHDGKVVCATSSEYQENIRDLLLSQELVESNLLDRAIVFLEENAPDRALSKVLTESFGVSTEMIEGVAGKQVRKIVLSFFKWCAGTFSFEVCTSDKLPFLIAEPLQVLLSEGLNPQRFAIEGSRLHDEGNVPDPDAQVAQEREASQGDELLSDCSGGFGDYGFDLVGELSRELEGVPFNPVGGRVSVSPGLPLLKGMLEELHSPGLGDDVTLLVLRFASELMNRAVIFLVRKEDIVGLGQFGLEMSNGGCVKDVRDLKLSRAGESIFSSVLNTRSPQIVVPGEGHIDSYLIERLGGERPKEIFLGPIVRDGEVVAIIYGDNLPDQRPVGDTQAFEIFLSQVGVAMEKMILEKRLNET